MPTLELKPNDKPVQHRLTAATIGDFSLYLGRTCDLLLPRLLSGQTPLITKDNYANA